MPDTMGSSTPLARFMGCVMRLRNDSGFAYDTFLGLRHRKDVGVSESSQLEESAGARPHVAQGLPIAQGLL